MSKRVLIVDGSIWPDIYGPAAEWRALLGEVPSDVVHLPAGGDCTDLEPYSHVIITGSEDTINNPKDWYHTEARILKDAATMGKPILGSCFGHQMLAWALSGERYVSRSATPEIGWISVDVTGDDPLLDGLKNPFFVFSAHFDEVISPPSPWRVIAHTSRCKVHVMRYGDDPIWGIQSHPEITPEAGKKLLAGFLEKAPHRADHVRPALDQEPKDDYLAGEIVRRFLER